LEHWNESASVTVDLLDSVNTKFPSRRGSVFPQTRFGFTMVMDISSEKKALDVTCLLYFFYDLTLDRTDAHTKFEMCTSLCVVHAVLLRIYYITTKVSLPELLACIHFVASWKRWTRRIWTILSFWCDV
jgi:hypothetical protein